MSDKKYQICGTLYENCPVTKENEQLQAENERFDKIKTLTNKLLLAFPEIIPKTLNK